MFLGDYIAGDTVYYEVDFHADTGALADPSPVTARLRDPSGTWSSLSAPTKQDSETGCYGGTIDTTGYASGQWTIRVEGTVATAKSTATTRTFKVGAVKADVISISSDSTAADNLELQFDGTGLTGNTFPATQLQITNLPGVIWNTLTSTLTTVGSIGKHLVDIALNAAGVRNNIIIVKSRQDNDYKEPGSYRFKGGRDFKNK